MTSSAPALDAAAALDRRDPSDIPLERRVTPAAVTNGEHRGFDRRSPLTTTRMTPETR